MTITAPRDTLLVYSFTVISSASLRHSRIILSLHDSGCLWWQPESCRRIKVYGRDAFRCRKEAFRLSPWGRSWTGWRYHPPSLCAFFSAATKHKIAVTFKGPMSVLTTDQKQHLLYEHNNNNSPKCYPATHDQMQYVYGGFLSQIGTLTGDYPWQCSLSTHNESMLCYYLGEKYAFPHYLWQV